MVKLCIADDEEYVVKSIERRIAMIDLEIEVAGIAEDGMEALRLYEEVKPDIFLVDIHMPKCSGLEFIEYMRRMNKGQETRFIIISGYDEFDFVKKALQMGVMNYIMKPISQQEFADTLREACLSIEEERKGRQGTKKEYWEDCLRNQEILDGTAVLIYKDHLVDEMPECMIHKFLSSQWRPYHFHGNKNVLLMVGDGIFRKESELREEWQSVLSEEGLWMVWETTEKKSVKEILQDMEKSLNLRFWYKTPCLISAKGHEQNRLQPDFDKLDLALESGKDGQYGEILEELFQRLCYEKKYLISIGELHYSIMALYVGKFVKYELIVPESLKEEFHPLSLARYKSRTDVLESWKQYGNILGQCILERTRQEDVVDEICRYLDQHYKEEITVSELAGIFFLAPNYMAKRFKDKTGMTVLQYLETIRISKAKEYLKITDYSISEIAGITGYSDSNYFARMFKKACGQSPREYRSFVLKDRTKAFLC